MIKNLRLIELELHSYCNRKCDWCPNSYIDRKSKTEWLDYNIFISLLEELKANGYCGKFSFSRYNEPFSNPEELRGAMQLVKHYFPSTTIVSNTNGDYINEDIIKNMEVDELTIMDYDYKGRNYVLQKMRSWNLKCIQEFSHYFVATHGDKKILYYYSWLEKAKISDRGGNLKDWSLQKRDYPCKEPLFFIGINYDGTVSPCCNVRNDCKNRNYILGDLNKQSLSEMMESELYLDFVNAVTIGNFTEDMPCYYCNNTGGRYTKENGGILY